jgi:hypothetical protein
MPSSFTWLDYSERDRRRALDVVDLFRESGTVDELGLGSIRDSYSDLFFPGTSTIQTRACYFLLLPWTFLRMERLGIPSAKAEAWARNEELQLNDRLLRGDDTAGVFGSQAGHTLKRLPSVAYWGGLASWGVRISSGIPSTYFRSLDGHYRRLDASRGRRVDPEGREAMPANWHPHIPDPPKHFPNNVSVSLRRQDAEYLCDRIQARHPGSLLAALVRRADPEDLQAEWPWELGDRVAAADLRASLRDARLFAACMHGAALLYNLMLAERARREELVRAYQVELEDWATDVEGLGPELAEWDLAAVWTMVHRQGRSLGFPTRTFVQRWVGELRSVGPSGTFAPESLGRRLVEDREHQLKHARARLQSQRHLELWGGRSGADRLAYRWRDAKVLLTDIFEGLERDEGDAGNA